MEYFGVDTLGNAIYRYVVENEDIRIGVLSYGGILQSLEVKDGNGNFVDVVLGYDDMEGYLCNDYYFSALIGRNGNRICGAKYEIDGVEATLVANENGTNQRHGGVCGFDKKIWSVSQSESAISLKLLSPNGDQGYRGNLQAEVIYSIEKSTLSIKYVATSDMDTLFNMTNHAYFNLDGEGNGNILSSKLKLFAKKYSPIDEKSIPTSEAYVAGTPFDFLEKKQIGKDISAECTQIARGNGYDHSFLVDGEVFSMRKVAELEGEQSGISMLVETTLPAVQLYTGNFIVDHKGKGGKIYGKNYGLCLETQYTPNAINQPVGIKPILRAGEVATSETTFSFSAK